ncbi:MAG: DUF3459 domain-containing protein [Bacteroidetes bacterium]|nr:MAG: DUF3459 domain-containing protein [Bacteroidota bacterium]
MLKYRFYLSFTGCFCCFLGMLMAQTHPAPDSGTHWGITYEIFVQAFADSNEDGIGDLPGLRARLDYLQELGVEALWLMPIHPSPSYHKYDVLDYYGIHPDYGSMQDFREMLQAAHSRGMKVIIDLVLNHTSDQHPWFQQARQGPDNPYRDYYVWSDNDEKMKKDPPWHWHSLKDEAGNPLPGEKYYGFFWHGMPDLNMDCEPLRQELVNIGTFWLKEVGVDGFRLDAAKFIYGERYPQKNHAWWTYFRQEMQKVKPDVYLVGEVWDGPEVIAPYLQGLHACFNFHLSELIRKTVKKGKNEFGLLWEYQRIDSLYKSVTPYAQDATFLTNHDQNRIGSELKGSINRLKMAAAILLTLPGSPYLYYGEELGMQGRKPDEYIREPFLWTRKQHHAPQSRWIEPRYSTPQAVHPLDEQQQDSHSLYHHYRKLIQLRKQSPVLQHGTLQPALCNMKGVLAFYRIYKGQKWLIIHNLKGRRQHIELPRFTGNVLFFSRKPRLHAGNKLQLASFSTVICNVKL